MMKKTIAFLITVLILFCGSYLHSQDIQPAVQQGHFGDICRIAVSPSGKTLATWGSDRQLVFWDLKTGMQLKRMHWRDSVVVLSFVNDSVLYLDSFRKEKRKLNVANLQNIESAYAPPNSGQHHRKYTIKGPLLQITENEKIIKSHTTQYFDKGYTSITHHPQNNFLFASAMDGLIYVYDKNSLKLVNTLKQHRSAVRDLVLSSDGKLLYSTGNDRSIIEWDATTFELKRRLHAHSFRITAVSYLPGKNKLFFGNELGEIKSLDLQALNQQLGVYEVSNDPVLSITNEKRNRDTTLLVATLDNSMYSLKSDFSRNKKTRKFHLFAPRQFSNSLLENIFNSYAEPLVRNYHYATNGNLEVYHADIKRNRLRRKIIAYNKSTKKKYKIRSTVGGISALTVINDTLFAAARTEGFQLISPIEQEIEIWKIKKRKIYKASVKIGGASGLASFNGKNLVVLTNYGRIKILNIVKNTSYELDIPATGIPDLINIKNGFCFVGTSTNELAVYGIDSSDLLTHIHTFTGHEGKILSVDVLADNKTIVTGSADATIKFWDLGKKELKGTLIPVDLNDFIFLLPNGNYQITKKAYKMFGFSKGTNFYFPDQFDVRFNRPHEIVAICNPLANEQILALKKAYDKRLKRMGFSENNLSEEVDLPELKISGYEVKENNQCVLNIEANDAHANLDRINVMINNVPVFGSKGYSLKEKNTRSWSGQITVTLLEGQNKIEATTLNEKGIESFRPSILLNGNKIEKPVLYVISIGISDYTNNDYDLTYPSKDAKDLSSLMSSNSGNIYSAVKTLVITDSGAIASSIESQCSALLAGARAQDVVVVFIAGHGVLDKELNYYLATHNMNFANPSEGGLLYEKLEALMDGIAPLRKTILIDACHSGELDKEEVEQLAVQNSTITGDIKFRTAGTAVVKKNLGLQSTSELMSELFTDLRRGTGATVVSSAGGAEFAMESDEWKNGLFTYCLLYGLKNKKADLNKDGEIMLSELQQYLQREVLKLSRGQQRPTSRIENLSLDFRVW